MKIIVGPIVSMWLPSEFSYKQEIPLCSEGAGCNNVGLSSCRNPGSLDLLVYFYMKVQI